MSGDELRLAGLLRVQRCRLALWDLGGRTGQVTGMLTLFGRKATAIDSN